jgi:hypothetical protein
LPRSGRTSGDSVAALRRLGGVELRLLDPAVPLNLPWPAFLGLAIGLKDPSIFTSNLSTSDASFSLDSSSSLDSVSSNHIRPCTLNSLRLFSVLTFTLRTLL